MKKKFVAFGFCFGLLIAGLVFLAERTTQQIGWLLIASFPLCWGIAGYLFWRWDIGAYRSEQESRLTQRARGRGETSH